MSYSSLSTSDAVTRLTHPDFVARPTPIYVFGDSHSLIFSELLFHETDFFAQYFITRARYIPGLCASTFTDNQSRLQEQLLRALAGEGLCDADLNPAHLSVDANAQTAARAMDKSRIEPILLFFAGDIDLRSKLLKQLGNQVDVLLPFQDANSAFKQKLGGQPIPFKLLSKMIEDLIAPLMTGLLLLRQAGFNKIFLHSLPPQTLNDDEFERINAYHAPVALRYKVTLAFNYVLKQKCQDLSIGFVDLWTAVTERDQLCEAFHLDHVHLNKEAAYLSIGLLLEQLTRTSNLALNSQYELLYQIALRRFKANPGQQNPEIVERFQKNQLYQVLQAIPTAEIARLRSELVYDHDVGNQHFRLDWVGNSIKPFSANVLSAELSPSQLRQIHAWLYSEPIKTIIQSCTQFDYTVLCCRSFKSLPHTEPASGPQSFHLDGNPPGLHRMIVYLTDVDQTSGPFEYIDPDTEEPHCLTAPAGSFHIFNANLLQHRGRPPLEKERDVLDIVLFPSLPGISNCVLWPGMNHWPVDPFHFSVTGYASWPAQETPLVKVKLDESERVKIPRSRLNQSPPQHFFNRVKRKLQRIIKALKRKRKKN